MGSKNKTTKTTVPSTKKPSASEDGGVATAKQTDGLAKTTLKKKEDQSHPVLGLQANIKETSVVR